MRQPLQLPSLRLIWQPLALGIYLQKLYKACGHGRQYHCQAYPDSAALSVSAILRAMASVPETCAASLAVAATADVFAEGAGAAAEALAARVGVMTRACRVALCWLLKVCQPGGGLLGVACRCHSKWRAISGPRQHSAHQWHACSDLLTARQLLCPGPLSGLLLTREVLQVKDGPRSGEGRGCLTSAAAPATSGLLLPCA